MARKWTPATDEEFERQFEAAGREGEEADRIEPRATRVSHDRERRMLLVELRSGCLFGIPLDRVPGLRGATDAQLAAVRVSSSGDGLLWDELDAHVSLTGLMEQALNLREWAPRYLGQRKSEAKADAARKNGLKGGRPRKPESAAKTLPRRSGKQGTGL